MLGKPQDRHRQIEVFLHNKNMDRASYEALS